MGRPMAGNLIKAGHAVRVWNRSPGPREALAREGAQPLADVREAFSGNVVMSMLADDAAVRASVMASGALDAAPKGLIHVNMATISVALALELAEAHRARGLHYVAAPVFGRPDAAAAAALTVLAAGEADAVEEVRPLLEAIGRKVWFLGDGVERANVVKIAGNFMLAAAIETMGEAAALVRGYGVEASELLDIMTDGLFDAPAYRNYGAMIAEKRYEPAGFQLRLGLKDVRLALGAGDARNVPLAFGSVLRDALLEAVAHGDGDKDWSALAQIAARRAGIDGSD
jgi:3-hydroxyisobutyrate dehydrogenase-like beta-hydroxyacid dehydrogenase